MYKYKIKKIKEVIMLENLKEFESQIKALSEIERSKLLVEMYKGLKNANEWERFKAQQKKQPVFDVINSICGAGYFLVRIRIIEKISSVYLYGEEGYEKGLEKFREQWKEIEEMKKEVNEEMDKKKQELEKKKQKILDNIYG